MYIDYALKVLGIMAILGYAVANMLVVLNYSIRFMWNEFWIEQKWFGKICANLFYLPAWVISFILIVVLSILNFIFVPLYKLFKFLAKWINPLFKRAIKLNL